MNLSDAALRKRAFKTILDWLQIEVCSLAECGTVEHETQQRNLLTDLFTQEFIALRDAARAEQREALDLAWQIIRWNPECAGCDQSREVADNSSATCEQHRRAYSDLYDRAAAIRSQR